MSRFPPLFNRLASAALLLAGLLAGLSACSSETQAQGICEGLTAGGPRGADLACVELFLETEKSWPLGTLEQARGSLASLREEAADLEDAAFYLRVSSIVALADNGHTNLSRGAIRRHFSLLPIRTYWFDDGLYVVRAASAQRELLGARVVEIAGHAPDALMAKMQTYYGGTDESFRVYAHPWFFYSPDLLHAAGLIPSSNSIALLLEVPSGERQELDLAAYPTEEAHPGDYAWRHLHPDPLPREGEGWATWVGDSEVELPWALRDVEQVFRYRWLEEEKVAHVQFRANIDSGDEKIRDFQKEVIRRLKKEKPRHLIWDQRQNGGGDLTRTADLARELHKHLPSEGRVFVLTTGATFSAGIYTAFLPKWGEAERTLVVGTLVGDRERFWAETGPPLVLPESGWPIFYSLEVHDLARGCHNPELCHLMRLGKKRWNLAVGSFEPEVKVPELSADLLVGRDAAVEWVLTELGGKSASSAASGRRN